VFSLKKGRFIQSRKLEKTASLPVRGTRRSGAGTGFLESFIQGPI
jgi:hypothetical protein